MKHTRTPGGLILTEPENAQDMDRMVRDMCGPPTLVPSLAIAQPESDPRKQRECDTRIQGTSDATYAGALRDFVEPLRPGHEV